MMRYLGTLIFALIAFPGFADAQSGHFFEPAHRLLGLGVERKAMPEAVLEERTRLMIESQTFGIMRDPQALAGAERITSPRLQKIFSEASKDTGIPAGDLAAIAYLESWGDAKAESPAGPKGIMQFSKATAERAGLKVTYATRYQVTQVQKKVRVKGKTVTRTVSKKVPVKVLVRDDRLSPELAIPAAAHYLAKMRERFGREDLAIFAYHCGEGCVSDLLSLAAETKELKGHEASVPRIFFAGSPAHNRDLYEAIHFHMARDYSPTYYFRIRRAEELLGLYKQNPEAFRTLVDEYRNQVDPAKRASNRLNVWLRPQDLVFNSCEDLKRAEGKGLARVMDRPPYFGFQLRTSGTGAIGSWDPKNQSAYLLAAPSAIGTLAYVSYETRRLFDAQKPKGEKFVPLEVTSLVRPVEFKESGEDSDLPAHCTGQVFDVAHDYLPAHEKEDLDFVLDDLGWNGYLGFVQNSNGMMHIGSSPSSRDFFVKVYQDALTEKGE